MIHTQKRCKISWSLLMSEDKAAELGIRPLARIISHANAALKPEWFTTAPSEAMPKAIAKAIDQYPELPEDFERIKDKDEKFDIIENDINSIKKYILGKI